MQLKSHTIFTDSALKAYYRAEDLNDSSTNGKNLTKNGTVNNIAAKFANGFSADFSTTNNLTNATVYAPGTGDVTLGCWFKKNGAPTADFSPHILSLGTATGTIRCSIGAGKTTGAFFSQFVNSGTDTASTAVNVCDDVFHFLVMTRNGTSVKTYIDGLSVGSGATSSKDISDDILTIGYNGSGYDYIGQALIDDVFVLSRALSASEILSLSQEPGFLSIL